MCRISTQLGLSRPALGRPRRTGDDDVVWMTRRLGRDAPPVAAAGGSGGGAESPWGLLPDCPGTSRSALGSAAAGRADAPGRREALVGRDARRRRVARRRQIHLGVLVEELPRRDARGRGAS